MLIGKLVPDVRLGCPARAGRIETVTLREYLVRANISMLVYMPGAFTPVCSQKHLPNILKGQSALRAAGVEKIVVITPDNPWALAIWADTYPDAKGIDFLSDGNGDLAAALGGEDGSAFFLGRRMLRVTLLMHEGVICNVSTEPSFLDFTCTGTENSLAGLARMDAR